MFMKRYFLEYVSDRKEGCGGTWNHITQMYDEYLHDGYRGNSMKTMRGYIAKIRRTESEYNPRDFRIYDYYLPNESDGHVGQCYYEQ